MSTRVKNDFYPTPPELALAIVKTLSGFIPEPKVIIESSAGTGAFIKACREVYPSSHIIGCDIDPAMEPAMLQAGANRVIIGDWEQVISTQSNMDVLMVGNDPFTYQAEHITAGLKAQAEGTWHAKLGRMGLLESYERIEFWKTHPCRIMFPLIPRPNFQKGQKDPITGKPKNGDSTAYMLYVWQKGYTGKATLYDPIIWR